MGYLGTKPANAVVTSEQLADGVVSTADIANSAITRAKMGYAGAVLQVVDTASSTEKSTTSTTPVTTGISASITPTSSTSKIKLTVNITGIYSIMMASYFSVYRNGTNLAPGGGTNFMADLYCNTANVLASQTIIYIDSPASTSTQTYTLYFWASSGTCYTNLYGTNGHTTIVLEEIAA